MVDYLIGSFIVFTLNFCICYAFADSLYLFYLILYIFAIFLHLVFRHLPPCFSAYIDFTEIPFHIKFIYFHIFSHALSAARIIKLFSFTYFHEMMGSCFWGFRPHIFECRPHYCIILSPYFHYHEYWHLSFIAFIFQAYRCYYKCRQFHYFGFAYLRYLPIHCQECRRLILDWLYFIHIILFAWYIKVFHRWWPQIHYFLPLQHFHKFPIIILLESFVITLIWREVLISSY